MNQQPLVGIVMGSDSDWPVMKQCAETLKRFGIAHEAIRQGSADASDGGLARLGGGADSAAGLQSSENLFVAIGKAHAR